MRALLAFLSGPLVFVIVQFLPMATLPRNGQLVLATFLWAVAWWVAQPVPWGVAALLPLVIFPAFGVMNFTATASLYGQNIFFWIMGLTLVGYAMEKHGLARRFALRLLSIKGVANTTHRLVFFYMLVTGLISTVVSDAATIAMMIPIGMSMLGYVRTVSGQSESKARSPLASFIALGTLYAAVAGGIGTIAGIPHNALSISLLEKLTGETISWFRWMKAGMPIFLVLVVIFYFILRFFFPPELTTIPGGQDFIRNEARKLGKMSRGEKNVLFAFVSMVVLFTGPPIAPMLLGAENRFAVWLEEAVSIWSVPPIVMLLLFALPNDLKKGQFALTWKDAVEHVPWSIMLLCTSAIAMTEALNKFGFVDFMTGILTDVGINRFTLPIVAAFSVAAITEFVSGVAATTLLGNIFIPAAVQVGFNPASIAMLIPNVALGITLPWAGAAAATAFASGEIDMKDMIKVGVVANSSFALTVALMHMAFAPVF